MLRGEVEVIVLCKLPISMKGEWGRGRVVRRDEKCSYQSISALQDYRCSVVGEKKTCGDTTPLFLCCRLTNF